jgi:uncharacterized protein YbjT (DUF2867 family)
MENKTIAVIGAKGSQGKGVVNALVNEGAFNVRAVTRNPDKYSGKANEAVYADLNDLRSLEGAFKDAHGVFVVTNFWEGADEIAQGKNAVEAAKATGVQHFIWSTLPDVEAISNGEFDVPHFTNKSKVDASVKNAGLNTQHLFKLHSITKILSDGLHHRQNKTAQLVGRCRSIRQKK